MTRLHLLCIPHVQLYINVCGTFFAIRQRGVFLRALVLAVNVHQL